MFARGDIGFRDRRRGLRFETPVNLYRFRRGSSSTKLRCPVIEKCQRGCFFCCSPARSFLPIGLRNFLGLSFNKMTLGDRFRMLVGTPAHLTGFRLWMIADHHLNVRDLRLTSWSNFSLLGFGRWRQAIIVPAGQSGIFAPHCAGARLAVLSPCRLSALATR